MSAYYNVFPAGNNSGHAFSGTGVFLLRMLFPRWLWGWACGGQKGPRAGVALDFLDWKKPRRWRAMLRNGGRAETSSAESRENVS